IKGPTICRLSLGKARRTSKPSPKSRTRGTTTSSSASHDLLLPRIGSAKGIQLITNPRFSYSPFELRSSRSALTQQAVSTPRAPVPNERRRRRPPHGRRMGTTGAWPPATRGSPPAPATDGPDTGRLLGVVFETVVPVGVLEPDLEHGVAGERQPIAAGRQTDHAVPGGVAAGALDDHP